VGVAVGGTAVGEAVAVRVGVMEGGTGVGDFSGTSDSENVQALRAKPPASHRIMVIFFRM
jgi:hypothetical protein